MTMESDTFWVEEGKIEKAKLIVIGILIIAFFGLMGVGIWQYNKTERAKMELERVKIEAGLVTNVIR